MEEVGTGGLYQLLRTQPLTEMVYMSLQQLAFEKVRPASIGLMCAFQKR